MDRLSSEEAAGNRARWLAELADALDGARHLVKDLGADDGKLEAVDPETLSDGDRRLRDAALKVAQEITAHPDGTGSGLSVPLPHDAQPPPAPQAGAVAPETASVEATDTVVRDASKQLQSIDRLLQENPQ